MILQAPPGAGKSTALPLALLQSDTVSGHIIMLEPRRLAGAVHHQAERILEQALAIARGEPFAALDGSPLRLTADSLCVHGDNAESLAVLRRLRAQLDSL